MKHGSRRRRDADAGDAGAPRLQKVLAAAGLGSRRECEQLIVEGRVEIDRRVIKKLGTRVDPHAHEVRVDGEPLARARPQYFMLNKPPGVVSTARDPAGRPRVIDLVHSGQRLFPVGRLDLSSEGLILLTNDGELANLLAHPRYEVEKTYLAEVAGVPSGEALAQLQHGVHLAEGFAHAKRIRIKSQRRHSAVLEVVLDEGRNREVRRLLARAGHKVLRLKRIAIGGLPLGDLAPGEYRPLRSAEVRELKDAALAARSRPKTPRRGRSEVAMPSKRAPTPISVVAIEKQPEPSGAPAYFDKAPRRTGTILGADDQTRHQPPDRSAAGGLSRSRHEKRRSETIKPIIDVRRGIFPHTADRLAEDYDDEDPIPRRKDASTSHRLSEAGPRPPRKPGQDPGHRNDSRGRTRKKTKPHQSHGQFRPLPDGPAKGRRRSGKAAGSSPDVRSKHRSRRKGRRR